MIVSTPVEDLSRPQSRLAQHLVEFLDRNWTPFVTPHRRSLGPTWMEPQVAIALFDYYTF